VVHICARIIFSIIIDITFWLFGGKCFAHILFSVGGSPIIVCIRTISNHKFPNYLSMSGNFGGVKKFSSSY
jgi:hypothetical protein